MKQVCLFIALAVASVQSDHSNASPSYAPVGVQNDVPVSNVLEGGWRILYRGGYSEGAPSVHELLKGACTQIMLASKRKKSEKFDVLATIETSVFKSLKTDRHSTFSANGAQWYKNEQSLGFAGMSDMIDQTSADTKNLHERDRLSWHTIQIIGEKDIRLNPGWRSGSNFNLEKRKGWERFILTSIPASSSTEDDVATGCVPIG